MIESAAPATRLQALELLPGFDIPETPSLWAEALSWACDACNRTATGYNQMTAVNSTKENSESSADE